MSLIDKILAAECVDPAGDVSFVVVLRCESEGVAEQCRAFFPGALGEVHAEMLGGRWHVLFRGAVGGAAEPILEGLNPFLDEQQDEVELVETKFINDMVAQSGRHSFIFTSMGTPDATTILLSPSHAFGSGDHPSTGLAIEFLQGLAPLHDAVLDVGCGTGVLSFVALRLGAGRVLGVDIDEEGVRGARVNSSLNQLEDRAEFTSLPLAKVTGSFPLILANLTCSVLKYLLSDLTALAEGNGRLVVSGLQGRQGTEAEEFLTEYGWRVAERKSAGKWQALLAEQDGSKITS